MWLNGNIGMTSLAAYLTKYIACARALDMLQTLHAWEYEVVDE